MNDECGNEIISKKKTLIYWPGLPSCILCDVLCTVYVLLIPLTRCSYSLMYFVVCVFDIDILSFSFSLVYFSFPSLPPLLTPVFFLPSYFCHFLSILSICPLFFFSLSSSPSSYLFILPYSSLCSSFPLLTPLFFSILLFVHFFYTCHYRYILKLMRNVFINLRLGDQPSLN